MTAYRKSSVVIVLLLVSVLAASAFGAGRSKKVLTGVVNVNTAGSEQLQMLPGVGPKTAQAIIKYREGHGDFSSPDDLMKVKGIGKKSMEKLRHFVVIEGETTARLERPGKAASAGS
jgi:comEA protein